MAVRLTAAGFGAVFGFALTWTQMTDPDVIRRMLLPEETYLYLAGVVIGIIACGRMTRSAESIEVAE